jgi:7,8-dihydroneopterin aldolase/epimerase/oxygenase
MANETEPMQYAARAVSAVAMPEAYYRAPIMLRPMDHIFIRDFRLQTLIGFHRRERVVPQTIRLDLEIGIANAAVFTSDKVADCIDYDKVTARIREVASEHVNLVETLAERVARLLLDEFGAAWAKVSIAKLGILKDVGLVGVSVERRRT